MLWWSLAWFPYFYLDCPWPYCGYDTERIFSLVYLCRNYLFTKIFIVSWILTSTHVVVYSKLPRNQVIYYCQNKGCRAYANVDENIEKFVIWTQYKTAFSYDSEVLKCLLNNQVIVWIWISYLNFALILTLSIMLTQKENNRQLGTKLTRSFIHQHSTSGNGPAYRLVRKSG